MGLRNLVTLLLAGCLSTWLAPQSADARVYQRMGFSDRAEELVARLGWREGYATKVQVNGVDGRMEVFASRYPVWREVEQLRRTEQEGQFFDGRDIAWGFVYEGDQLVRYLLVPAGPGETATIFRLAVDTDDWLARRGKQPPRHQLTSVPVPNGADSLYHFSDAATRSETEVSRSRLSPAQAAGELHEQLVRKGWSPRTGADTALGVYTRRKDVLTIRVSKRSGDTIITRIYKRGGIDGA